MARRLPASLTGAHAFASFRPMDPIEILAIASLMALAAALYTSVGHAGASAYLAIMALFGLPQATMKPVALTLNIIVASLAAWRYVSAGQVNLRLLWPFVVTAIPAAFLAGRVHLPADLYRPLVGLVLWIAAARLAWPSRRGEETTGLRPPPIWLAMLIGAGIGLLSGLTGTGGGIFLSPLILLFAWEAPRRTSGVAALFILCVSISGLAGSLSSLSQLPPELPIYAAAVVLGALIGTQLGITRLPSRRILQALAAVLLIAGAKLIFF